MKGQHTGATLAIHLKDMLDHFELTNGRLLAIVTDNASSNYSMTREFQSTLEASAIKWPAPRNHMPFMAHLIQLALGAFMRSLGVNGAPSLGMPMSAISNLERMTAWTLGRVKDFEQRATLESIRCRP